MIYYISITVILSLLSITEINTDKIKLNKIYFLSIISLICFFSFRYNVGPDFDSYFRNLIRVVNQSNVKNSYELFYKLLNKSIAYMYIYFHGNYPDLRTTFVQPDEKLKLLYYYFSLLNFICIFICFSIFIYINKNAKNKFLNLLIFFLVFLVPIYLGYTRQFIALMFCFLSYQLIIDKKYYQSLFFLLLGIFFHTSLIIILFIYFIYFIISLNSFKKIFLLNGIILIAFIILLILIPSNFFDRFTSLLNWYVIKNINAEIVFTSPGLYFRYLTFIFPVFAFFYFYNEIFKKNESTKLLISIIYFFYVILIFNLLCILVGIDLTTSLDRIFLYAYPMHIIILTEIFKYISKKDFLLKNVIVFSGIIFYSSFFTIWLLYGNNSQSYQIYRTIFDIS
tara:strand:- start:5891 stop:7075 length:1185 start_codon:yes stop_codon:yes gene_type:complete